MSKRGEEKYRDNWSSIQIKLSLAEELKAEAEVQGVSIGNIIEQKVDVFRHLMMSGEELGKHFKKCHPELLEDEEMDLDARFKDHLAGLDYLRKVEQCIQKHRKGRSIRNIIASKANAKKQEKKAGVVA